MDVDPQFSSSTGFPLGADVAIAQPHTHADRRLSPSRPAIHANNFNAGHGRLPTRQRDFCRRIRGLKRLPASGCRRFLPRTPLVVLVNTLCLPSCRMYFFCHRFTRNAAALGSYPPGFYSWATARGPGAGRKLKVWTRRYRPNASRNFCGDHFERAPWPDYYRYTQPTTIAGKQTLIWHRSSIDQCSE